MNKKLLQELNRFLGRAALNTYAGGGQEVDPEEVGFKELEFKEGNWYYKDSYAGFFQSWGREVVWYNQKPVWTQIYGGGMTAKFQNDTKFAHETFDFLKKALSAGEKKRFFNLAVQKVFLVVIGNILANGMAILQNFMDMKKSCSKKKLFLLMISWAV
jgi:hypothetical protein